MKQQQNPKVSVIVLNWDGLKYIHECIDSVLKQTYTNIEILFVDNASTDNSLIECKDRYKSISFIENEENVGFAKGMNIGIDRATGNYILLLNTDVYLREDYISVCVNEFLKDDTLGCIAGYEYIWADYFLSGNQAFSGVYGLRKRLQITPTNIDSKFVFGVSGSFPMFSMRSIKDIIQAYGSFFDEEFGTGWEDNDLRFRYILRNWKTKLANTIAWHVGSASDRENKKLVDKSIEYQVRIFRNRFFIQKKYIATLFPCWNFQLYSLNLMILFYYLLTTPRSSIAYVKGYILYLKKLSYLNLQQKRILDAMIVNKKELLKYIIGF